jgi:hypothetical protein
MVDAGEAASTGPDGPPKAAQPIPRIVRPMTAERGGNLIAGFCPENGKSRTRSQRIRGLAG